MSDSLFRNDEILEGIIVYIDSSFVLGLPGRNNRQIHESGCNVCKFERCNEGQ